MTIIYKICPEPQWREAERARTWRGLADDLRDGFIHFSTAAQVAETARKHFQGKHFQGLTNLLLLEVDAEALGAALHWEPARGGALFPHLYGDLALSAVRKVAPLRLGPDGAVLSEAGA